MSDIQILKEMIEDSAVVEIEEVSPSKFKVVLIEPPPAEYSVEIHGMPDKNETIVIKVDKFTSPNKIFKGKRGECKRADFLIITEQSGKLFIVFIELKAGRGGTKEDIVRQLKGASCFVSYIRAIGQEFWSQQKFLEINTCEYRFVSIRNISINKKPTRTPPTSGRHDRPDKMLKISAPARLYFQELIGS